MSGRSGQFGQEKGAVRNWSRNRGKERGTRIAGASAGDRIAGSPRCCRRLRYMKVRHFLGSFHMFFWLARTGGDARTMPIWDSFCGGLQFIISMAERRSFGAAAGGAKGDAKVLHLPPKCNISVFGAPDQRERGPKRGEKCYKKMLQWGCYTFGQKSGEIGAPRERVFELILSAKSARKCGRSWSVVCQWCTGFVYVLYRFPEFCKREGPKPGCLPMYMKRVQFWRVSQI